MVDIYVPKLSKFSICKLEGYIWFIHGNPNPTEKTFKDLRDSLNRRKGGCIASSYVNP